MVINQSGIQIYYQILLEQGLKGSRQLGPLQKLVCTFLYQMGIQIYDQILNRRIWSKVKLHHSISLRFGLKEGEMALRKWKQMQPFRPWFHQVCLRSNIAQKPRKFCTHNRLSLKWVAKFSFKFQLQESQKNNISQTFT